MRSDRRTFLKMSIAASGALALQKAARAEAHTEKAPQKLKILVLGGTKFLGPATVDAALARGHEVVLFNRGKTNPGMYPELEKLQGNRDPKKDEGLKALEGRAFDVVFDDSGYFPAHVGASADLLAKNGSKHYVFVSSISAYAENTAEGADETAALATMADPNVTDMGKNYEFYGPLKVLCEQASEKAFPGRCTVIRPGYIVGPNDPTDRFTYWPWRIDKGGTVLVPGAKTDPLQIIDVRDLGTWMVRVAEQKSYGTFNACGPKERLAWGDVIDACVAAGSAKDVKLRWASLAELEKADAKLPFPIWAPYAGDSKGFHTWSNARAVAAGLTFRPIKTIVSDTLAWFKTLPEDQRKRIEKMVDAEKEAEVLKTLG